MMLKSFSGGEIREDLDYNTMGIDPDDKEWRGEGRKLHQTRYYLKDEVDAILEDKDKEIAHLRADVAWHERESSRKFLLKEENDRLHRTISYNKYRRCLDMVKWCRDYREGLSDDKMPWEKVHRLYVLYGKWMNRWRELAELFRRVLHV